MADRGPIIPEGGEATYERFRFAPAFRVGDTVYVSGVIGTAPDGAVPASTDDEYANVFAGLSAVLQAAGSSLADVVDMTSFHVDMPTSLGRFMKAKSEAMSEPHPAWTAIGCTALAVQGATVEVKATAVLGDRG